MSAPEPTTEEKGLRFEEYVVRAIGPLTKQPGYTVTFTDWRGDKHIKDLGVYPQSNSKPDLEFEREWGKQRFAFECKWRGEWTPSANGGDSRVTWVSPDWKFKKYIEYSQQPKMLCHLVLGIGWTDDSNRPEELYLIPMLQLADKSILHSRVSAHACENLRHAARELFQTYGMRKLRRLGDQSPPYFRISR